MEVIFKRKIYIYHWNLTVGKNRMTIQTAMASFDNFISVTYLAAGRLQVLTLASIDAVINQRESGLNVYKKKRQQKQKQNYRTTYKTASGRISKNNNNKNKQETIWVNWCIEDVELANWMQNKDKEKWRPPKGSSHINRFNEISLMQRSLKRLIWLDSLC